MATEQQSWFESSRSALCMGWRMAMLGQDQRHAANLLEAKRIARDRTAVQHMRETLAQAKDWQEVASAYQHAVSEYFTASVELLQEETALVARGQSELNALIREAVNEWEAAWTKACAGIPSFAGKPLRAADWFQVFDRTLTEPAASERATAVVPKQSTRNGDARASTR